MNTTARRRALEALKRQRAPAPAGPLFAPEEDEPPPGAEYDKVAVLFPLPLPEPFDYRAAHSIGLQPGMHVIAPTRGHYVHYDDVEFVVDLIREIGLAASLTGRR